MHKPFILLVDDETSFIETMSKRLQKREFTVMTAASGQEALEVLRANRHLDVVVLDVKMPGMDGIETLQEIKKAFPLTEVIMLTGHATIESAIDGMKTGAFDYLMKPCDIDQLVAKVMEAGRKKQEHAQRMEQAQLEKLMSTKGI
ncbi:response regulator [Desulfosudis oleivorans]|jgi:DNA-binding NtrC family response regulator|uniref:Response regulator receiver protein n=1 Tax=Desulfosudis oleivorans (strain DSM 6200 / JCM 39069 / Hxd3) TaxID=96561 RepID=A8ZYQ6_DESOH|nr:response regulator [Desulfosudis oleivorans]ABW67161.1 response regulator receiver protein [Desulfosudis oleivorans Hxd3]